MEGTTALLTTILGLLTPILLLQTFAYGQFFSFVPGTLRTKPCSSDIDCDDIGGDMICWWLYEGCHSGQCMCDPRTHVTHSSGRCVRVRRLNEPCDRVNDTCSDMLACLNGTCRCPHSQPQHAVSSLCIHPHFKPLGSRCNPSSDTCYHESVYGFAEREVGCTQRGFCRCKDGYKQDGRSCRRLFIWETGCKRDYDCEGGAVCVDEQCACPTGYKSIAGNTKCAKYGATLELPLRSRCDEINERSYCAQGLVCHRCRQNEAIHVCARYVPGFQVDSSAQQSGGLLIFSRRQHLQLLMTFALCLHLALLVSR